ncbi:MAG: diaminopimelate decarboxylase, partial [Planctomycetales bacterium]|nr:diaminopimelate decarboxylase [Planctomycetales bacterium]
ATSFARTGYAAVLVLSLTACPSEAMPTKTLPIPEEKLLEIAAQVRTPFHLYDEAGIRSNARALNEAFSWAHRFREYFAVKATPNPHLLRVLGEEGCGVDCSSMAELVLAERVGMQGEDIMFTSNNTPLVEYQKATDLGAIVNLDDISHIEFLKREIGLPDLVSCRYNPGPLSQGSAIIGTPVEAKFGFTREQFLEGYRVLRDAGVKRFGLHAMIVSNELNPEALVANAKMLFELAVEIHDTLGVAVEMINLGGGIGVAYRPDQTPVDLAAFGAAVHDVYRQVIEPTALHPVRLMMENGRCMTGPFGVLVTRAIHTKNTYRDYIGVDASMANLMRPGMYGAYHHITVLGKSGAPQDHVYDIVGSLCENNDKFAIARELPEIEVGDVLAIHDAGAHGHSMGFQYNGKLRSAEYLLKTDGELKLIRRAETLDDYFSTLVAL